ncbi:hypothetical protein CEXT_336331 [Caerostris extrusa]|uniref:Uncharacterized protein n=1 Tax=Caerostris extrusa TaxID=172846 RepID=A0AAV4UYR2_CAEEX|nr:hypothetical protein CEXT_336331 [Caerostris extrusa]
MNIFTAISFRAEKKTPGLIPSVTLVPPSLQLGLNGLFCMPDSSAKVLLDHCSYWDRTTGPIEKDWMLLTKLQATSRATKARHSGS